VSEREFSRTYRRGSRGSSRQIEVRFCTSNIPARLSGEFGLNKIGGGNTEKRLRSNRHAKKFLRLKKVRGVGP